LHPRTKVEGYTPPAHWDLIAEAKALLSIPVVGNGDILTVEHALKMLKETRCDALMIGRGSVINPFIFHQIKAHFAGKTFHCTWDLLKGYLQAYVGDFSTDTSERGKMNKMKQLLSFLYKGHPRLVEKRQEMLTGAYSSLEAFIRGVFPHIEAAWSQASACHENRF
jgi:tRNA-dihydrouridine synthase C